MKYQISKEYLEENYIKLGKSSRQICKELGIKSKTVILRHLKKYKIKPHEDRTGTPQPNTEKYGELYKSYVYILKNRAKRKGLEFNLSGDFLWDLFIKQGRKCALSGLDINMPKTWGVESKKEMTASIDRIDSSKGYIKSNVQWVHKKINNIKMDLDQSEFIDLCKKVTEYNDNYLSS